MKQKDSFLLKYPFSFSNGYIGLGKRSDFKEGIPFFYIKEFDPDKEEHFQPESYFKAGEFEFTDRLNFLEGVIDYPSSESLKKTIKTFLADKSDLEKVVLAKKRTYRLEDEVDPLFITQTLLKSFPQENIFVYSPAPVKIFFGASPERLYLRENNIITIDSIAGTAKKGEEESLFSEKNQKEHKYVTDYVVDAIKEVAGEIKISSLGVKNAKNLIHLHQTVTGILKPGITDSNIISILHPTPAVLGFPKKSALSFLKAHETFDRGYYAGCLGWMDDNNALLRVGIRSGLIENNKLTLYAGAGITKQSDSDLEIIEIDNKFKTLEGVFLDYALST